MKEKTKAFCCWSGGKESALSFYRAQKRGIDIFCLLNMISEDGRRSRSHGIDSGCLKWQAETIGIPIIQKGTSWQNYESKFKKVIFGLKSEGINAGIFGDIDLQEHRDWVERVCKETGIKPILPLWQREREELLNEFIRTGFKAIVVATQAEVLGKEWLGREINKKFIEDLKTIGGVDICGEKGEYHTFVYDGPIFKKRIEFSLGRKALRDKNRFLEIMVKEKE